MSTDDLTSRLTFALWRRRNPGLSLEHPDRLVPQLDLPTRALPRYAADRIGLLARRWRHGVQGQPWITYRARHTLQTLLRPGDRGLEFGSGGSTEWLARTVACLISVEAFDRWHEPLVARLTRQRIDNVELHLVSARDLGYESAAHRAAYVNVRPDLEPQSLDFVFVDGEYRDDTALRGIGLLKEGGLLILDNSNAYLPAPSRTPWKVAQPASPGWAEFAERVDGWRRIWTSNGVWDTTIWIKP